MSSTSAYSTITETISKGLLMVSADSQQDGKNKAEAGKENKMLSVEQVEKLLRRDAEAYMKQFEKTPQELRQWFDRMIEQLEREGLDKTDSGNFGEPDCGD